MQMASLIAVLLFGLDLAIRVGLSVRVIMRRLPVGTSLAWLGVILIFPFAGALIYLLIGEQRLGNKRAARAALIHQPYQQWLGGLRRRRRIDWSALGAECEPMAKLTESCVGIPALAGNHIELITDTDAVFEALIKDIEAAHSSCHLEFYIWNPGGKSDQVADAMIAAAARGVHCRVLLDAVGSADFFRSPEPKRLQAAGVEVHEALPVGLLRMLAVRSDLRLHRKIVVIDGEIAYTGSLNLVDPRYFKQHAGFGQWIDAMVRLKGPSVEPLAITFIEDWELECGQGLERLAATTNTAPQPEAGESVSQVIPSGPAVRGDTIPQVLLMAIYAARHELIMTTPYFVPDESLLTALISATRRGVEVTIIVPQRVDSLLVRLASQASSGELTNAGIRILLFKGGLLHTKSVTVDGEFALFGSLNLDPRSLHLNFEITLAIYDRSFTAELRSLQHHYREQSVAVDPRAWEKRSPLSRLTRNVARLLGPVL